MNGEVEVGRVSVGREDLCEVKVRQISDTIMQRY